MVFQLKERFMRKSTLFLSAVLTTFMLAVMVGAVSAYQKAAQVSSLSGKLVTAQQDQSLSDLSTEMIAGADLTPEQAAALAAQVIGRTDLYSVETSEWEGQGAYLVTFSSGDLVYVSPDGEILSIGSIPPVVITESPTGANDGDSGDYDDDEHDDDDDEDEDHEDEDHEDEDHEDEDDESDGD
jgi:hypothetical protein